MLSLKKGIDDGCILCVQQSLCVCMTLVENRIKNFITFTCISFSLLGTGRISQRIEQLVFFYQTLTSLTWLLVDILAFLQGQHWYT